MNPPVLVVAEEIARQSTVALLAGIAYALPIFFVAWLIIRLSPRANAATRYGIWSAALIATLLLDPLPGHRFGPFSGSPELGAVTFGTYSAIALPQDWALALFLIWYVIATALVIRLIIGHLYLQRIKDHATPLPERFQTRVAEWLRRSEGRRFPRLLVSSDVDTPLAFGLLQPAIVIPQRLIEELGDDELDQICLHELAHLQRADDWTNLAQKVAEALLFFSPAVHLIAREMSVEREIACDDWVVAMTGRAQPYATCLTRLAELSSLQRPLAMPSLGAFVSRKQIVVRVERLLNRSRIVHTGIAIGASWMACLVFLVLLAGEAQLAPFVTLAPRAVSPLPQAVAAGALGRNDAAAAGMRVPAPARLNAVVYVHIAEVSDCARARARADKAVHPTSAVARSIHRKRWVASVAPHAQTPSSAAALMGGSVGRDAHAARQQGLDAGSAGSK